MYFIMQNFSSQPADMSIADSMLLSFMSSPVPSLEHAIKHFSPQTATTILQGYERLCRVFIILSRQIFFLFLCLEVVILK